MKAWLKSREIEQEALAKGWGINKKNLSAWVTGRNEMPDHFKEKFRQMEYPGPWPKEEKAAQIFMGAGVSVVAEPGGRYETGMSPRHVEQAFKILMEVADLHQAKAEDFDRAQFGRVLGIAARELARSGDAEEVRREVVHEAETLLGLLKK